MDVLHLVRYRSPEGLIRLTLVALALLGLTGCERPAERDPELRPDVLLRDSLGLTDDQRVHTVTVTSEDGRERAEPPTLRMAPDAWVQFTTGDRRIHTVTFEVDSLGPEAEAFLQDNHQASSPPLVERDARFLVDFRGAPSGRYPYVVEGSGTPQRGAVVIEVEGR